MKPEGPQILNTINPQTRLVRLPVPLFWRAWPYTLLIVLVMCVFPPLVLLVPFPVAMSYLRHGNTAALKVGVCTSFLLMVMAATHLVAWSLPLIFAVAWMGGFWLTRMVRLNHHPSKTLLQALLIWGSLVLVLVGLYIWPNQNIEGELTKVFQSILADYTARMNATDAQHVAEFFAHPEQVVHALIQKLPSYIFGISFGGLWLSAWFLLRHKFWWQFRQAYRYQVADLLYWKNPDFLLIPVLGGLILAVLGSKAGMIGENVGINLLRILTVAYVLQFLGVAFAFLKHWKIGNGFLRALILVLFMIQAWPVMAALGLLDCWVNFRKFLNTKIKDKEN